MVHHQQWPKSHAQSGCFQKLMNLDLQKSRIFCPFAVFGRFNKTCPLDLFCLTTARFPPKEPGPLSAGQALTPQIPSQDPQWKTFAEGLRNTNSNL
jgi:hypothetical protein